MQGDFTRWTFAPERDYRSVLLQQGRAFLDADWNEQTQITARHDEVRMADLTGASGGPLALAGFAVVDAGGAPPQNAPWADLRITPGRYYVDGVLAESPDAPDPVGWPLAEQPHLRGVTGDPGLAEPADAGRYALYLDVWTHHVTADEQPALRESALGGPDTTTRAQTVWQARLAPIAAEHCADLQIPGWLRQASRQMVATLQDAPPDPDPCRISAAEGYRRLENQLYRVQVHATDGAEPTFLWSRENGSVVAGLTGLGTTVAAGMDAALTVDRQGRDDELAIGPGAVVEVTSADLQLQGRPGFLATVGVPDGLTLPVAWTGPHPASLAALGRAPIVRRWEGPAQAVSTAPQLLEGGIQVAFPAGGTLATGDHWLIPARAVRLVYGLTALAGTLDWPADAAGVALPQPPLGPIHHLAPLAILDKTAAGWTRESDCRRLFPPVTELITLDLIGGDGQEALPGAALAQPVRVAVRNGGLPVSGAALRCRASDNGTLVLDARSGTDITGATDGAGVAELGWTLNPTGPSTQTLRVERVDEDGLGIDVPVIATARLSVAAEVAWTPACDGFADAHTVQEALDRIATRARLMLRGGDGQHGGAARRVLPQRVRVVVDSPCGPVGGAAVSATATDGALVAPAGADARPDTLDGTGATNVADVGTDPAGAAEFWWQPFFEQLASDTLTVALSGDPDAPVVATAQRLDAASRTPGVHVAKIEFRIGAAFENDDDVDVPTLLSGILVELDGPVDPRSVEGKPVVRVTVDLPWPATTEDTFWGDQRVAFRTIELISEVRCNSQEILWSPSPQTANWVSQQLPAALVKLEWFDPLIARFVIDGWAVVGREDRTMHLNGHAASFVDDATGRTRLLLPTDDEVTGGQFAQWFRLHARNQ